MVFLLSCWNAASGAQHLPRERLVNRNVAWIHTGLGSSALTYKMLQDEQSWSGGQLTMFPETQNFIQLNHSGMGLSEAANSTWAYIHPFTIPSYQQFFLGVENKISCRSHVTVSVGTRIAPTYL